MAALRMLPLEKNGHLELGIARRPAESHGPWQHMDVVHWSGPGMYELWFGDEKVTAKKS